MDSLRALLFCALCFLALPAGADVSPFVIAADTGRYEVSPHVEYLEDPHGRMTLGEAMDPAHAARYRSNADSRGDLNLGFTESAYWLRFKVVSASSNPSHWLLEIAYPALDRVEVFVPDESGNYLGYQIGDAQPFDDRAFEHRNLVMPLTIQNGSVQTIYMRVTSKGSLSLPMRLWETKRFAQEDGPGLAWLVWYLGMLGALMVYNLMLYASIREKLYLMYVGFAASMALAQASYSGVAFQYLWPLLPNFADVSIVIWMAAAGIFGVLFTREFLRTRLFPSLDRQVLVVAAAFGLSIAALWLISFQAGVYMCAFTGLVAGVHSMYTGVYMLRRHQPGARFYLIAWSSLSVGVIVFALRVLGWLPSVWITAHALQIGSAIEMLLLAFALADRINVLRREKDTAQAQTLQAKEELVRQLKDSETELAARVEERTRELETANAHLERLVRHDALTGVANRVLLQDRMSHALLRCRRDGSRLAVLQIDLDRFKHVNDVYGHAAGDRLLIAVAQRFESALRDADTLARVGGDEFVVLLEDVADRQAAEGVAVKLQRDAARPFDFGGQDLHIGASVGIALYPEDGTEVETLLERADANMYRTKRARREAAA
jgi:two-component system, sensor histidine kinase LadS